MVPWRGGAHKAWTLRGTAGSIRVASGMRSPRRSAVGGCARGARAAPRGACRQSRIGVVLLHGKQSAPDEHAPLAEALAAAGYLVERPEMCWSARRIYDLPYLQCLREIDAAIGRLQRRGATAFVVAGHSLGANGALGLWRAAQARRRGRAGAGPPAGGAGAAAAHRGGARSSAKAGQPKAARTADCRFLIPTAISPSA